MISTVAGTSPAQLRCEQQLDGLRLLRLSPLAAHTGCVLAVHEGHVRDYGKAAYHDFHTLTFHLDGAPLQRRGDRAVEVGHSLPGRVSLQACDARSRWDSSATSRWAQLYLPVGLVAQCASRHFGLDPARLALVSVTGVDDPALVRRLYQAVTALQTDSFDAWSRMDVEAWEIAVHWIATYSNAAQPVTPKGRECLPTFKLRRALAYIDEHLDQDVTVAAIAREIGVSPAHFARAFRRATGESPHRHVLRRRADRARRLLGGEERSLADIALDAGFANQAHLTSVFAQHFGVTPGAYRRHIADGAWRN